MWRMRGKDGGGKSEGCVRNEGGDKEGVRVSGRSMSGVRGERGKR